MGHENLSYSYRYAGRLDEAIAELRTGAKPESGIQVLGHGGNWRGAAAEG